VKAIKHDEVRVGSDVWVFGGPAALPTRGTVTEMLHSGGRQWGVRVMTGKRGEREGGEAYAPTAVFLRPQHREQLIGRLMDEYDALSSAADRLANDNDF